MKQKTLLCTLISFFLFQSAFSEEILSCRNSRTPESKLIQQSHGIARRVGKHILEINYAEKKQLYADVPPYDELGGTIWSYCGYNERAKAHLIGLEEDGLFSGKIMFENSTASLDAGHTVMFSPTNRYYLSIEQPDGLDGENWFLRDRAGNELWHGYAGITIRLPGNSYDSVYAQFEEPRFSDDQTISAYAVCSGSKLKKPIILKVLADKWQWIPHLDCPQ